MQFGVVPYLLRVVPANLFSLRRLAEDHLKLPLYVFYSMGQICSTINIWWNAIMKSMYFTVDIDLRTLLESYFKLSEHIDYYLQSTNFRWTSAPDGMAGRFVTYVELG